tara:strand:+ start:192 stop:323 length:132 start_codon:yes stop_codon:yes gene_type:complete
MDPIEKINDIAKDKHGKEYSECTKQEKAIILKQWIDENIELIP